MSATRRDFLATAGSLALSAAAGLGPARAGVWPGATQASHTAFISLKVLMSVSQILAESSFDLSLPTLAR